MLLLQVSRINLQLVPVVIQLTLFRCLVVKGLLEVALVQLLVVVDQHKQGQL